MDINTINTVANGGLDVVDKTIGILSKLNHGLGFFPSLSGKKQDEEEAIRYLKESIMNDESIPPLLKAAQISKSRTILREYLNQNAIVNIAIQQLSEDNKAEQVDVDWLSHFMDAARHVTDSEIQQIWGKLLANECDNPGFIPKTLLHTLSYLSPELAKCFEEVCSFTVRKNSPVTFIDWKHCIHFYKSTFQDLKELERHDLIFFEPSSGYEFEANANAMAIYTENRNGYLIEPTVGNKISLGCVLLSEDGKKLYSILNTPIYNDFDSYVKFFCKKNNLKVTDVDIISVDAKGQIEFCPKNVHLPTSEG